MAVDAERPSLTVPWTSGDRALVVLASLAVLAMVVYLAIVWPVLPDRIPTHFDAAGTPDRWDGRGSLVFLAGAAIVMYALLGVVARFPRAYNYPVVITAANAPRQYWLARRLILVLQVLLVALFLGLLWGTVQVALGHATDLPPWPLLGLVPIFAAVAWYFVAARRAR